MTNKREKLYKKLITCRGCLNKSKDGPYHTCKLVDMFYPNAPLAAIAQGVCIDESKYPLYDTYLKMVEAYNRWVLSGGKEQETNDWERKKPTC